MVAFAVHFYRETSVWQGMARIALSTGAPAACEFLSRLADGRLASGEPPNRKKMKNRAAVQDAVVPVSASPDGCD